MTISMLTPHPHAVKHNRFVPATAEAAADMERQIGRNLYRRGKRITECTTDDMAGGWLAEEQRGADAYYRQMMAEAVN
jgi:hypothetical protein